MLSRPLSLAFSPCPNDTFIFEALVHNRLKDSIPVEYALMDIEKLNEAAAENRYDVIKISTAAYPAVSGEYEILSAGAALGRGCGPLLISKNNLSVNDIADSTIAIPGFHTTANLLLSILYPQLRKKTEVLFSEIEETLLDEKYKAGVIIHESRFTYASKGLHKIVDLGEQWEQETGYAIPLGCIVIRRNIPAEIKSHFQALLKSGIEFAYNNRSLINDFIKSNAREMNEEVQNNHIQLYVNSFSLDLGDEGRNAIRYLLQKGFEAGLLPQITGNLFFTDTPVSI